jgi:predicted esterase
MLGGMTPSSSLPVMQRPAAPAVKAARRGRGRTFLLGFLVAPVAVLWVTAAAFIGASPSGWGYAVGFALVSVGLLAPPGRRGLAQAGLALMVLVAVGRLVFARGTQADTLRLPDEGHRWVNRLVAERDGTLLAGHLLVRSGRLPRSDSRDFLPALEAAFDRMDAYEGALATPAVATYLGLQSPESFDAVVIPPRGDAAPRTAVVFLHGFAGNFAVYCWEMAQSVQSISALTVCPSVGPAGDWWSPQGERTLEKTFEWLAERGVRRVYLGGLSNGGAGASILVNRVSHPGLELRGLVLVSGADSKAPLPRVPTLMVQGRHDSMMPTPSMRAYAERLGRRGTYVEVDSGHFAFLDHHVECERAISGWLVARERE